MNLHIDFVDLRLFVSVAEEQNLTRGAKNAFLSTSAASGRLKGLEEQLGSRLFYRDTRGLELAPAGQLLLRHARAILHQVERLESEFCEYNGGCGGHIRIYANTTAVTEFMPKILADFLAARPTLTIDLQEKSTKSIIQGVRDGAADLGIAAGPIKAERLEKIHFSTDRLVVATSRDHRLSRKKVVKFAETLDFEQVTLYEGSTLQRFVRDQAEQHGRQLQVRVQVRSFESMCRIIESGVGIGILPESAAYHHRRTMGLGIMHLSDEWATRERYILVREPHTLPHGPRALIKEIQSYGRIQQLPPMEAAAGV